MIWLALIIAAILTETLIKNWAEHNLQKGTVREILNGKIILRKFHNPGFLFQKGEKYPWLVKLIPFIILFPVALIYGLILRKPGKVIQKLGGALLIGGGVSNLADRWFKGYVTDYFSFNVKYKKIKRIVFNLADIFIILGSIFICLGELFNFKK